jgi:argininosuccinate lyase
MKSMAEHLYRSRLTGKPSEIADKFMSSLEDDMEILPEDIVGTEAHDIMLCEQGIITKFDLKKILGALERIRKDAEKHTLKITGKYEDIHEFLENQVINEIGIEVGGKLHTARSRNDQVALDVRMKTRTELNLISGKLIELIQALLTKASDSMDIPMILYTHTQHAQIGNFAHYLLAQIDLFLRDLERLDSCYTRVNRSPLGGSAIGGTRFPIDRRRSASLLGFEGVIENSMDAVSARDFVIETASCLSILTINMSRVAEDLIVWSSSEFGYVELADEYASTSSVMPQKKNPCTLELIRGSTGVVCGSLMSLIMSIKGLPSGYNRDLQATKTPLWIALKTVKDSLGVLTGVISSLRVKREHWVEAARNSFAVAVDLAEELTAKGLTFRKSHMLVGALVKDLVERKQRMNDLTANSIAVTSEKLIGEKVNITDLDLTRILDPLSSLEARQSMGSPSPIEVERMFRERKKSIQMNADSLASRIGKLENADSELRRLVNSYISE